MARRKADAYRPETVWYKIKSQTYTQSEGRQGRPSARLDPETSQGSLIGHAA